MNSVRSVAAIPRAVWRPPPRPVWVSLLNRVGVTLGSPAALVPLDEPSLLEVAKAATGLEDFGDDCWRGTTSSVR